MNQYVLLIQVSALVVGEIDAFAKEMEEHARFYTEHAANVAATLQIESIKLRPLRYGILESLDGKSKSIS